jgi:hypothetical protein
MVVFTMPSRLAVLLLFALPAFVGVYSVYHCIPTEQLTSGLVLDPVYDPGLQ